MHGDDVAWCYTANTNQRLTGAMMVSVRSSLSRRIKPKHRAILHYLLEPYKGTTWGGAMNGQSGRMTLCRDIISAMQPSAIVETGTFIGATTKFFSEFDIPVHSVEADEGVLAIARMNTRRVAERISLTLSDSRSFLRKLASDPEFVKVRVFFYLDAHWDSDLPLADEVNIIFDTFKEAVIMIDDFQVPGDSYGHDDYGPGAALNAEYLDAMERSDMYRLYPSLPAIKETGAKRGCVVLCNDADTHDHLSELSSLRLE